MKLKSVQFTKDNPITILGKSVQSVSMEDRMLKARGVAIEFKAGFITIKLNDSKVIVPISNVRSMIEIEEPSKA